MIVNVIKLNEKLSDDRDAIETLLNEIGCENIHYNATRNEIRCSRDEGKNPTAVRIKLDTLRFSCFSTNEQGSLYNLIMAKTGKTFPETLSWVSRTLNLSKEELIHDIKLPFGGFYKQIIRAHSEPELCQKTYEESILEQYGLISHMSFIRDGIDIKTQEFFHLGYDIESNRITIPQWDFNGNIVGIMGRSNDIDIPYEYRWLPVIPCSRSYTLFGYHQNYAAIQQQQLAIVTESEKGVMQLKSMGYDFGLATCTRTISSVQAKYLKALRTKKIILAYDEGISEDELIYEAMKIKVDNPILKNSVGYIYDKHGEILKSGTKMSPTDIGSRGFKELIKKTVWI